jgi:hypothetical protein
LRASPKAPHPGRGCRSGCRSANESGDRTMSVVVIRGSAQRDREVAAAPLGIVPGGPVVSTASGSEVGGAQLAEACWPVIRAARSSGAKNDGGGGPQLNSPWAPSNTVALERAQLHQLPRQPKGGALRQPRPSAERRQRHRSAHGIEGSQKLKSNSRTGSPSAGFLPRPGGAALVALRNDRLSSLSDQTARWPGSPTFGRPPRSQRDSSRSSLSAASAEVVAKSSSAPAAPARTVAMAARAS